MSVTVVGLGKIGLPLAVQFARSGMTVIGADTNPAVVDLVNSGQEPFPGEAHLADYLAECVAAGTMSATTDTADAVSRSHAVVVVVPLFVDADARPDFGWMDSATEAIGRGLRSENQTLVCYETTLPVGTTRTRWKPMLERVSGLVEGVDFDLVFSPERVLTGRVFDADQGERYGVVNYRTADGEGFAKAVAIARKITSNAPMTAFAVMHALPRIAEMSPSEGLFAESLMASVASNTPEAQDRLRAFLEGRAGKVVKEG